VERNILDLAARRGLSLYTRDNSEGTLDLTSFSNITAEKPQMDAPAKKKQGAQKGDFIFRVDDMLAVLFPHMYEDVEYLVPEEGPIAGGSGQA
jgi:E3 ubiquitin-protein ligase SHPRH